jgi:hypothetical protein
MLSEEEREIADEAFKQDFPGDPLVRKRLLAEWKDRAFYAALAHYSSSESYELRNKILTITNMISAICVLFAANNKLITGNASFVDDVVVAVASLFTVLSTAVQFLLRYEERSTQHKLAANEFSNLKRKIERYLSINEISNSLIHNINRDYNFISKNYPLVSHYIWKKALRRRTEISKLICDRERLCMGDLDRHNSPSLADGAVRNGNSG